jgi:xanthine/uracil permease
MDICQPDWFDQILDYSGSNTSLVGFEQGINLVVQTPFVAAAVISVILNLILPKDKSGIPLSKPIVFQEHELKE